MGPRRFAALCVLCLAILTATGATGRQRPGRAASHDGPGQLVATFRVDAGGAVSLVGAGRLPGRAQTTRDRTEARDFLAVLETADGTPLGTVAFDDPTRLRAEWSPDGREIAGEEVRLPSAEVAVRFRDDAGAARVRVIAADRETPVVSKIRADLAPSPAMRTVGVFELDAAKLAAAPPPPSYTTETIVDNGPSENRLDIVFLGDGYTANQLTQFRRDVLDVVEQFAAASPYDGFMPLINVHIVNVVSNQSGIDDPAAGVSRDTALDLSFNIGNTQRCVYTRSAYKVYEAASLVPEYDEIFVLANDPQYGGCGGDFACFTLHPTAGEIAIHEFGHSFGLLADEYGGNSNPPRNEPSAVNVTLARNLTELAAADKWDYWVPSGQTIPTPEGTSGVGLFRGAVYTDTGAYRPIDNCRMRILGVPYCPICLEQLVRRLHAVANPIESFTSSPEPMVRGPRTVATLTDPAGDSISPVLDVRSVEIVQTEDALRLSLTVEAPFPDPGPNTDFYYAFQLSNETFSSFVYFDGVSRKLLATTAGGNFEDFGIADFAGTTVSGSIPIDRFHGATSLTWRLFAVDPSNDDDGELLTGSAFSLTPVDQVILDTASAFSGDGTPLSASGASYATRWRVDGEQVSDGQSFETTGGALGAGIHTVEFEVSVSTPLVRRDPLGLLDSSRSVSVAVCGTGPTVRKVKLTVTGDGKLKITGSGFTAGTRVQVNGLDLGGSSQIKKQGKVLLQSGPLSNGLPVSSVLTSGQPATVLIVAPSGDCSTTSVTPR